MVIGAAARVAIIGSRRLVSSHTSFTVSSQCRQMSMDARSVSEKLRSSGLLRTQGLIGGKWIDSYDKTTIKVNNPATGEIVADVACMGVKETNDAIASFYEALPSWSRLTAGERSKVLRRWYDLLIAHKEELGQLITLEQGKPPVFVHGILSADNCCGSLKTDSQRHRCNHKRTAGASNGGLWIQKRHTNLRYGANTRTLQACSTSSICNRRRQSHLEQCSESYRVPYRKKLHVE